MFTDATFDSLPTERHRRGLATLTSFGLQAILVTCMMLLPLYYTQVMPLIVPTSMPLMVPIGEPRPEPQPPHPAQPGGGGGQGASHGTIFTAPIRVPNGVHPYVGRDEPTAPDIGPIRPGNDVAHVGPYVPGATGSGSGPYIPPRPEPPQIIKLSHMSEGSLVYRVEPPYPIIAKTAGIHGPVELAAIIGRDGRIENLQVLSGHPLLVQAALDAVSKWRYRPYILNDQPIEVETRITVNFILAH